MRNIFLILAALTLPLFARAGERAVKGEITSLAVTPDGKTLLVGSMDGRVRVIDLAQRKQRAEAAAHKGGVWDLALSPDGKRFLTGGPDNRARAWDAGKLKEIRAYEGHKKAVSAVALSPDGKLAASGDYAGVVHLWEVDTGKLRQTLPANKDRVTALAFSPDGKRLAGGGVEPLDLPGLKGMKQASRVRTWGVAGGDEQSLGEFGERLAFLPGGNDLVSVGWYVDLKPVRGGVTIHSGSRCAVWDRSRKRRRLAVDRSGLALCVSADGRYLATGWGSHRHSGGLIINNTTPTGVQLLEIVTGKVVWSKTVKEADAAVLALTIEGGTLVAGDKSDGLHYHALEPEGWKAPGKWVAADYRRTWDALSGDDPAKAYTAVWDLSSLVGDATAFLRKQMKQAVPTGPRVRKLIADLDSGAFATRQAAQQELDRLGEAVEPLLREALQNRPSAEVKRVVERLLARVERAGPSPERLRDGRVLTVLERIGSPAARSLLETLGKGASGVYLTEERAGPATVWPFAPSRRSGGLRHETYRQLEPDMSDKEEQLQTVAAKLGIGAYKRHVLLCTGPSCCTPEEGVAAWEALKGQIKQHNLGTGENACYRTKVGCLRICCHGPTMVVYPEGTWYHGMTADKIPQFVQEHLVDGEPVSGWIFAENPLGE